MPSERRSEKSAMLRGFVPWPAQDAAAYRAKGWWQGRTLWDVLTPADGNAVKAALAGSGIDPATVQYLQPWMAELMLSAGLVTGAQVGVELTLDAEVDASRKRGLETAEEQIGFLAEGTEAEQVANLMSTVRQMGGAGGDTAIGEMMDAWERGDAEARLALQPTLLLPQPRRPLGGVDRPGAVHAGVVADAVRGDVGERRAGIRTPHLVLHGRDDLAALVEPVADELRRLLLERHTRDELGDAGRGTGECGDVRVHGGLRCG